MTPQQREFLVKAMGARTDWWALRPETAIAPEWEVIDSHCHLWPERDVPDPSNPAGMLRTSRYLTEEFLRDTRAGHKVAAFVYVECGTGQFTDGPQHLRPVGETGFALELARTLDGAAGKPLLAAIVAHADLAHPALDLVLDAHDAKGKGLVRAIRHSAARLDDPDARLLAGAARRDLYADPMFRQGVARLGERGFAFEAFQFQFQLQELADLVSAVPGTTFVVNHLGAPVGFGRGPDAEASLFAEWAAGIDRLARYPNVIMKLGGMASPVTEYDAPKRPAPPSSAEFVRERGAYFHHAIRSFGAERCMFESNFPVDSVSLSYTTLWNAYKIIAADYPTTQRNMLLADTARRIYGLDQSPSAANGSSVSTQN